MTDRYRYKILQTADHTLLLRDDGYRIWFLILHPAPTPPDERHDWELWAEYKQCDLPKISKLLADELMKDSTFLK